MTDLTRLTAVDTARVVASGEASAVEVAQAHLDRIGAVDERVHAFLHVDGEGALAAAKAVDDRRAAGEQLGPLAGVPLALKDVFTMAGVPTTCGSKILEGWRPPYDATVTSRLQSRRRRDPRQDQHGRVRDGLVDGELGVRPDPQPVGPRPDPRRIRRREQREPSRRSRRRWRSAPTPAGRSASRRPSCGTVGVKPTYGGVSRYGLVAFASSLDQAGPCARNVLDAALLHEAIAGHDPMDSTSIDRPVPPVVEAARRADVKGMKVGVVREFAGEGYQSGVSQRFTEAVELLASLGAEVVEVSCPHFDYALAAYYLIAPSECSSNLARFDAMRYGLRVGDDGTRSAEEVMSLTRAAGFGDEVKRRIILGTYALSSRLLRRLLRAGAEGAHAHHRRLHGGVRQVRRPAVRRRRRRRRSRSASGSTTRWRCTSPTCAPSRATSPAARR